MSNLFHPRRIIGTMTPQSRQLPILEFTRDGRWRVWLSYNDTLTSGSYYDLYSWNPLDDRFTGAVDLVTIGPDGSVSRIDTILTKVKMT